MGSIKNEIVTETDLEERARSVLTEAESTISTQLAAPREAVVRSLRSSAVTLFIIVASILGAPILGDVMTTVIVVGSLIVLLRLGRRSYLNYQVYVKNVNRVLIGPLSAVFAIPFTHEIVSNEQSEMERVVRDSGLFMDSYDRLDFDDAFSCCHAMMPIVFREVQATRREGSGKQQRTVIVFKGVLVTVQLPRRLSAKTYISTESVSHNMEHQTFWQRLTGAEGGVSETELEWNEFERDLHVASNDPVEARYVLTPDFMVDLHEWWKEGKENIRICFKENVMIMFLPDRTIAVGTAPVFGGSEAIFKHFMTIVRPLWRVLQLVEDVRL